MTVVYCFSNCIGLTNTGKHFCSRLRSNRPRGYKNKQRSQLHKNGRTQVRKNVTMAYDVDLWLTLYPRRAAVVTYTKTNQIVQKMEWKRTDRRTRPNCNTFPANAVGNSNCQVVIRSLYLIVVTTSDDVCLILGFVWQFIPKWSWQCKSM